MLKLIVGERRCLCRHRMAVCRSILYQCSSATDYVSVSRTLGYGQPHDCPTGYLVKPVEVHLKAVEPNITSNEIIVKWLSQQ